MSPTVLNFTSPVNPGFHFTTAGNWGVASNWSGNALPGTTDEVFIDANCTLNQNAQVTDLTIGDGAVLTLQTGKTLTVSGTLTNTAASRLVIEDGAQLLNASPNVAATVKKDIVAFANAQLSDGWYTIASPVNAMAIEGSDFLTETYDLYRFAETNQSQNEWENYRAGHADFTVFENGRGYLYANSNTFSPAFTGVLNNADVKYSLTYTNRPNDELDGFNLVGNPFPHEIYKGAGGAVDDARLASGYYTLTNEGAWHTNIFKDAIQPGQGFLVKTSVECQLNLSKTNLQASAESSAKAAGGMLEIGLNGMGCEDRTLVFFSPGIGLNKIANLDETIPSLCVRNNGANYAITHTDSSCESLELMFKNSRNGDFTIKADSQGLRLSYLQLIDRVTGVTTDLLAQPTYSFKSTGNEQEGRFLLVLKVTTGVNESAEEVPFAFVDNGQIILMGIDMTQEVSLQVMDLTGRVLVSTNANGRVSTDDMAPGVYVLRLVNGKNVKTQKIIVR